MSFNGLASEEVLHRGDHPDRLRDLGLLASPGAALAPRGVPRENDEYALVRPVDGFVIGADGTLVEQLDIRIERLMATRWQVGEGSPVEIDEAGLPVLDGGETWPLEVSTCSSRTL